jgi:acid phosphatase class B
VFGLIEKEIILDELVIKNVNIKYVWKNKMFLRDKEKKKQYDKEYHLKNKEKRLQYNKES